MSRTSCWRRREEEESKRGREGVCVRVQRWIRKPLARERWKYCNPVHSRSDQQLEQFLEYRLCYKSCGRGPYVSVFRSDFGFYLRQIALTASSTPIFLLATFLEMEFHPTMELCKFDWKHQWCMIYFGIIRNASNIYLSLSRWTFPCYGSTCYDLSNWLKINCVHFGRNLYLRIVERRKNFKDLYL